MVLTRLAAERSMNEIHKMDFKKIDAHVIKISKKDGESMESVANYILKPCKTLLEKARAIFCWISHNIEYDFKSFKSGKISGTSPESVFKSKSSVCEGYAEIFCNFCEIGGIQCKKIHGHGRNNHPKDLLEENDWSNHAWAKFQIDDEWYLCDPCWGAGTVDFLTEEFKYCYNALYFCCEPEIFIWNHFPVEKEEQLLKKPLSKKEYINLPFLKPNVASFDWEFETEQKYHIKSKDGLFRMKLKCDYKASNLDFKSSIRDYKTNKKIENYSTFCLENDGVIIIVSAPEAKKKYEVLIWILKRNKDDKNNAQKDTTISFCFQSEKSLGKKGVLPLIYDNASQICRLHSDFITGYIASTNPMKPFKYKFILHEPEKYELLINLLDSKGNKIPNATSYKKEENIVTIIGDAKKGDYTMHIFAGKNDEINSIAYQWPGIMKLNVCIPIDKIPTKFVNVYAAGQTWIFDPFPVVDNKKKIATFSCIAPTKGPWKFVCDDTKYEVDKKNKQKINFTRTLIPGENKFIIYGKLQSKKDSKFDGFAEYCVQFGKYKNKKNAQIDDKKNNKKKLPSKKNASRKKK